MHRRTVRMLAVAGLASALLAAPPIQSSDKLILTGQLGMVPWKTRASLDTMAARAAFDKYSAAHPEVEIQEFERIWLPGNHWGAAQIMSLASGAGPDMLYIGFGDIGTYVREGLIQSVDGHYDDWDEKARWSAALTEPLKLEGHVWGAVADAHEALLAGNHEVFAGAGMTESALPRTWEQAAVLAGKLAVSGRRSGFGLVGGRNLAYLWMALTRAAGGDAAVRVGTSGVAVNLAVPEARRAAEVLADFGKAMRAAGPDALFIADSDVLLRQAFAQGRIAFGLFATSDLDADLNGDAPTIKNSQPLQLLDPYLGPVPGLVESEPLGYTIGGDFVVIPSHIRDKLRKDAIWEFYTLATNAGSGRETELFAGAQRGQGKISVNVAWRQPTQPAAAAMPAHWLKLMADLAGRAAPMPPDQEFEDLAALLGTRLTALVKDGGDAGAALAAAQSEFEDQDHLKTRRTAGAWQAFGWVVLGIFAAVMAFGLWRLVSMLRDEMRAYRNAPIQGMDGRRWAFAMTLFAPAVLLSVLFGVLPLFMGLKMSAFEHVLRDGGSFVGVRNYLDVIVNPLTHVVVGNTLLFIAISFVLSFLAPLALALVLSTIPFAKLLIRSAFFLPAVASAVVVSVLWQQMYDFGGPFNSFMQALGFAPRKWLAEPSVAMFAVVLPQAWATLGVSGLTYLAGLSAIPEALYEEAELSGAGVAERFQHVTYPHIRPLIGINLVGWLIAAARTAEQVFLLTGGGPGLSTYVVGLDIFNQAYVSIRFGYAMAEVWLLVAIILIFSIYQMRAIRTGQLRMQGN